MFDSKTDHLNWAYVGRWYCDVRTSGFHTSLSALHVLLRCLFWLYQNWSLISLGVLLILLAELSLYDTMVVSQTANKHTNRRTDGPTVSVVVAWWFNGKISDLQSTDRWFDSRFNRYQVVTTLMDDCLRTSKPSSYTNNAKVNSASRSSGIGKSITGLRSVPPVICDRIWQVTHTYSSETGSA